MNEKEILNFGSAQSQKQLESARGRPHSGNDANLSLKRKMHLHLMLQLK